MADGAVRVELRCGCASVQRQLAGWEAIEPTIAALDLEHHGVATVPGTAFGAPGSIRLSFACSEAEIAKAMERMQTALGSLG